MSRILVVDDVPSERLLTGGLLGKRDDWTVAYAESAQQALDLVESDPPDAIVTDMVMPGMDGLELVKKVREAAPQIPVVLVTGLGNELLAVRALEHGAASYVPKRQLARELPATVERVLGTAAENQHRSRLENAIVESRVELEIGNDAELLSPLATFLCEQVEMTWGLARHDRMRVCMALEESLSNALYHGNLELSSELRQSEHGMFYKLARERARSSPWNERRIRVTMEFGQDEVAYTICDEGRGFDPSKLPDPTDEDRLDLAFGRGIMLMRSFMDDVRYNDRGNEVTLVRRREHVPASSRK